MLPLLKFVTYFGILATSFANGLIIEDLGGTWTVKDAENEFNLVATVPGGIYSDLQQNNITGDIFWGFNDVNTRWVAYKNWTYSRNFTVSEEFLDHENINVIFDGVDTFASLFINDVNVGSTDNMFVRYEFNIKTHLQPGENNIMVKFASPVEIATYLFKKHSKDYIVPPTCVPTEYHGECHANHIRKMQSSFGWDWGPAFPSVGIWKPVYLEAYNSSVIRDVTVSVQLNSITESWDVEIHTYFANTLSGSVKGILLIVLYTDVQTVENVYNIELPANENFEFVNRQQFSIPKLYVTLWWPNGYGNPVLYQMKVTFISESEVSVKRFKIGFRTINLNQNVLENENGTGTSFYFVVNNVLIFAKGANAIPINILPEKGQNSENVRFLLQSAKDVNMNMLRVWGGGVYESDEFYKVADELGLLIWQDFMFACSMYPTNEEFLSTVKAEVRHQVRRLQHHASVAVWAANNENEAALRQNWYGTADNFELYKRDFVKLYVDTIRKEVFVSDATRPFLTSSPTNGAKSEAEGYVALNPESTKYGDVHYYNYVQDSWNQNIFPVSRFTSEYGYQSLPTLSTFLTATDDKDNFKYNSKFLLHRQHHSTGYEEMKLLINKRLMLPSEDGENFFKAFIYYSQIIQAEAVKLQTEYYRLWRSNLNSVGEGLTMGALYWQLNDVWVAPTWSGIDFKNKWKMLHYYAKDFFAPVIVTSHLQNDRNVKLFTVSDLVTAIYNVTAKLYVYRWNSFVPIYNDTFRVNVLPGLSSEITSFWLDEYLSDVNCGSLTVSQYNCFIYLSLEDGNNKKIAPDNRIFPSPLNLVNLTTAIVNISSIEQADPNGKIFDLEILTNAISLFVWLDSGDVRGMFSDNGFLQVTQTKSVRFYPQSKTNVDDLRRNVKVTHLADSQYL